MQEQKRVSFEVSKSLKEAGYPQDIVNAEYLFDINGNPSTGFEQCEEFVRPTYLEVWLWLWREKDICLDVKCPTQKEGRTTCHIEHFSFIPHIEYAFDPEEAIISAIEYLVENKLLK